MEFLGVRVVRGPDWEWSDQDGGEGSVGTVFQIGSHTKSPITEPIVLVQWDCGRKANYRAGMDGKYDLRILDTANGGERHLFTPCDGCQRKYMIGSRWHCKTCPTYDLCTQCYMTDCHDKGHAFERIDKSRSKGVNVGTRWGSTKLKARGLFKGAKVIRGPECEVNDQDGDPDIVGVVEEVVTSNDEDTKDSVRVSWKKGGPSHIYRVGKDGKVDLKCTVPAIGGSYYRDHLPPLVLKQKKSQGGLTTGDKVFIELSFKRLKKLSSGHGEWNRDMFKFMRKVGVVQDFTSNGDVIVEYPDKRWRYAPEALKKVQQVKRGDDILVKTDKNLVKELQDGHGEWNEGMVSILGRSGKVLNVDGNGDLMVLIEGKVYYLNPAAVACVTDPVVVPRRRDSNHANEIPIDLALFHQMILRGILQQTVAADIGSQELLAACGLNMLSRVREILVNNPQLIDAMVNGQTALHVACHYGHCDIIRELIDRGADKEKLDNQGYTATHNAAIGDKTGEVLKLLLNEGSNPNVQDSEERNSPLHLAVHSSNEVTVRILTQYEACDVNLQDQNGDTPLHCAIAGKEHNMVDMLLDNPGLIATITNHKGFNYLQFAVLQENKVAVEKLLEIHGSTLNVATDDGFTTLHIAAINGYREIAKTLLEQPGCCVNAEANGNQTPLHLAAERGYPDMAEDLLDHGADVNAANSHGDTPLHISLKGELMFKNHMLDRHTLLGLRGSGSGGEAAVSKCLLNYGADVQRRNNTGETPLDRCRGTEVEQVIRDFAAKGNSNATKVSSFEGETSQGQDPGLAHQGANDSTEAHEQVEPIDHSDGRETKERRSNDDVGHGKALGEIVNDSQEGTQEKEGTQGEEQKQDVVVQNCIPLIQNVILEAVNQVLDPSLDEISNNKLNKAGVVRKNGVVAGTENADLAEEKDSERETFTCRICDESEAVVAFKPCGHIILCLECAPQLKRCLECQTRVTGKCTRDGSPVISVNSHSMAAEYKILERKMRELEESIQCCICSERKKNVVFPCGHGTCQYCADHLEICHMCYEEITKKIKIF